MTTDVQERENLMTATVAYPGISRWGGTPCSSDGFRSKSIAEITRRRVAHLVLQRART